MDEIRLIDANALISKLKERKDFYVSAWGLFSDMFFSDKSRVDELDSCIAEVVNAPTVEQKELYVPVCNVNFDKEQLIACVDKAKAEILASITRSQGKWIIKNKSQYDEYADVECSNCNRLFECWDMNYRFYDYCPHCGAQMEVQNETNN